MIIVDKIEMDEFGPLDHGMADRMAEERSQYHISEGQWARGLYIYAICDKRMRYRIRGDFAICDSDIASGDHIRDGMGGRLNIER